MHGKVVSGKIKKREGLNEGTVIFYVAVSLFLVTVILDMSLMGIDTKATQLLRYTGYGLILIKILRDSYEKNRLLLYLGGLAVAGAGFVFNHNKVMLLYIIVVLAAINIEAEKLIKLYLIIQSIMLVFLITASAAGFILDFIWETSDRTRHFLGFDYTTSAPIFFLFIILEYVFVKKGKINLLEYIAGGVLAFLLYKLTDTTLAFLMSVGILTFFFLYALKSKRVNVTFSLRHILCAIPWLSAGISIAAQIFYNKHNALFLRADELLHKRLRFGHAAIGEYGFSLFGRNIEWVGSSFNSLNPDNYNYVDCSYLQIALQQGILFLILVLLLYSFIIWKMIREEKYFGAWIAVFIALFSMSEPRLVNIVFNPFVIVALTAAVKTLPGSVGFNGHTQSVTFGN